MNKPWLILNQTTERRKINCENTRVIGEKWNVYILEISNSITLSPQKDKYFKTFTHGKNIQGTVS